ncbi:hypothetical protein LSCM1_06525 [Leishmania martiniquensis]|uniref:Uncharacterized protein n=1 Tax=Leishmania martiniquensis TaxID=1580590 RepID=A0A836GMG2_9TRYP|nr:hypothetical protein LSCM1_06525 [Leishmania martiniquensis]
MSLDDVDRWRGGGRGRDRQSSRYASEYSGKWNDTYRSVYEPPPPRRYFNAEPPSPKRPSRRSAPPPPPPPPSPPLSTPPLSHSAAADNVKRKHKHHSKRRRTRCAQSTSFTSSIAASTEPTCTSSRSTDSATGSTSSGSSGRSDSERTSTSTASSTSISSSSRKRRAQQRKKAQQHLQQHAKALSRVAGRPSTTAQDEEIAAAAACRALLKKEAQLREKELRLLQQKRNFAAEVQRRSSQQHRFVVEDDAIRQMQRLVDLASAAPALEEYVRRTSRALPVSGASTDAGALTYLRSYEGSLSGDGVAPLLNRIAAPRSASAAAAANVRSEERTVVVSDEAPVAVSSANGSSRIVPASATPFILASAPTASDRTDALRRSTEIDSLLEHSLPVESRLSAHSVPPTLSERVQADNPSERRAALPLTIDSKTENTAAAAGAAIDGVCIATRGVEERGGSAAPATAKAVEAPTHLVSVSSQGRRDTGRNLPPQRRVKVKVRRRRSALLALAQQTEVIDDLSLKKAPWTNEEGDERAASPPHVYSQPVQPQELMNAPRQLLPPPPTPAFHAATEQQHICVDPLQRYSQGGATQQPWVMANWPCNAPTGRSAPKSKDGPPALWYASSSPAPLSHREFKSLLCSEYVVPETSTAPWLRAAAATANDGDRQVAADVAGSKAERESYEPYGHNTRNAASPSGAASAGGPDARRSSRLLSACIGDVGNAPEPLPAEESALGDGGSQDRTLARLSPPPPVALGRDDEELVVEFPPPPHMMASDMPPPGDVGSDGEDSCCGCGSCECSCCSAFCANCYDCWLAIFSCLFPCCCKKSKAVLPAERPRPLTFQRPTSTSAPPVRNAPIMMGSQP